MKTLLTLLILTVAAGAQVVPRDPLTVDRTNKRVNESFKIPSGKLLNIESGGGLGIVTAIDATPFTITSTFNNSATLPLMTLATTDGSFFGDFCQFIYSGTTMFRVLDNGAVYTGQGYFFTGDTNTGVTNPGADQIALIAGSSARLTASTSAVTLASGIQLNVDKTITAGATTGAQTINKIAGSVNLAASATSLVVTNSKVTTSSVIMLSIGTNDASNFSVRPVAASGSFTIHVVGTAPAAETRVNFWVIN